MKTFKSVRPATIILGLVLVLLAAVGIRPIQARGSLASAASLKTIPTFTINSVDPDQTVSIKTANFPANDTFDVRMGAMGTRGVGGIKVATVQSGAGGSFTRSFNIPDSLKGSYRIAIRLESPASGYYSYNWFYNNTSAPSDSDAPVPKYPGVIPTFKIVSVDPDDSVTIKTANFPANDTFNVRMGAMGTRGVNGILVETVESGDGGAITWTFNIPNALKSSYRIAIRLESPSSGYYSYNWFYNLTSGTSPSPSDPGSLPSGTIPTFTIVSVIRNDSVTVKTANFPANDMFNVRMGAMGTRGVGGVKVDTVESNDGGAIIWTFNIPDSLKGSYRIAIRLESPTSGYYSYNWFYNNTTN